ncbi:DUF5958 family protein [Streptomyces spiralis]|uniref:DUF5958 family protein n=1 Tax=Streptomyces spiralis TaxID=66376 RepID=UPI0033DBFE19
MTGRDVIHNELAQGLRCPTSQGIEWFDGLGPEEQSETLRLLRHHCVRARAVIEDGPESVRRAGLRPTHTPAVLITRGRIDQQLGKIAGLSPLDELDERRKAFRLLIAVLAIADARRRERVLEFVAEQPGEDRPVVAALKRLAALVPHRHEDVLRVHLPTRQVTRAKRRPSIRADAAASANSELELRDPAT